MEAGTKATRPASWASQIWVTSATAGTALPVCTSGDGSLVAAAYCRTKSAFMAPSKGPMRVPMAMPGSVTGASSRLRVESDVDIDRR